MINVQSILILNYLVKIKRYWLILFFKIAASKAKLSSSIRKIYYRILGLNVGKNTNLPHCYLTWPHNVSIGFNCIIEHGVTLKHDGPYFNGKTIIIGNNSFIGSGAEFNIRKKVVIGDNCLIASGCRFIDHDHGFDSRDRLLRVQSGKESEIELESDVWLGANVVILKGVKIGCGAIVGSGAVVTSSIPPYEIWAGVPARKVAVRP